MRELGLAGIAERLLALPASCGPVRLVAVDGHAGSGKTTFAARLASCLGDAPVVHLDDLATHEELFAWTGRLGRITEALARGEEARYPAYDWVAGRFAGERAVPAAGVVLVEGVGAGRRETRPLLAHSLWMDVPREVAHARGELRDGPGLAAFWRRWKREEDAHFAADPSWNHADLRVRATEDGYRARGHRPAAAPSP